MPYIDLSEDVVVEPVVKPSVVIPTPTPGPVKPSEKIEPSVTKPVAGPGSDKILSFKVYLNGLGFYNGDVTDPTPDPQFITAVKSLENSIAESIGNKSVIGLIWQGNGLNPQTSVEDIENAMRLIAKKGLLKGAQATVDTFDVEEYQDNPPSATKQNLTRDDAAGQSGNPDETQQGLMVEKVPEKLVSMDDRVVAFVSFLNNISKNV